MLSRKLLSVLTALLLVISLSACQPDNPTISAPSSSAKPSSSAPSSSQPEKKPEPVKGGLNPLTGELTLKKDAVGQRPVAVVINNVVRSVQSGLAYADVVFEVEVEGGITRLLAVFSDPTVVGKIGTIRSMRVPLADLARGMNAVLFFHGMDEDHCLPHLSGLGLKYISVDAQTYGFRENNGFAYEHRLTTSGELIDKNLADKKIDMSGTTEPWLSFSDSEEKTAAGETSAKKVNVSFSSSSINHFIYDEATKKYSRATAKDKVDTDYYTDKAEQFTNIFIVNTTYTSCEKNKHRFADLSSGSGWYISAGGAKEIKWSKGNPSDNFVFTNTDGTPLTVNQGNSYVCIRQKNMPISFE